MVGDGTIMSWSTDHYTSPIQGSEIWYPWCLVGASLALCASSSPFSVYVIGGGGPSKRALASALPMAGTVSRGVVYAFDRTLWLTGADGQLTASGVTLPVDWARTGGGDYNAAEKGALAPLASLATDRLVWVGRDNAVRETDMTTGVSSVLATPAVPVTAVVNSGALTAWRTGPTITIAARSRAAVTESAGSGDKPSLAAHGDGVAWIDGRAVRAVSVDGRRSSHCLGSAVVALAADGGHLYALTSEGNVHRVELR